MIKKDSRVVVVSSFAFKHTKGTVVEINTKNVFGVEVLVKLDDYEDKYWFDSNELEEIKHG